MIMFMAIATIVRDRHTHIKTFKRFQKVENFPTFSFLNIKNSFLIIMIIKFATKYLKYATDI